MLSFPFQQNEIYKTKTHPSILNRGRVVFSVLFPIAAYRSRRTPNKHPLINRVQIVANGKKLEPLIIVDPSLDLQNANEKPATTKM